MRDTEQEEAFVAAFVVAERRDRYTLLLATPKRRRAFLDRLNHRLDFIASLAWQIPANLHTAEGVARLLNERGVRDSDTVYVFSDIQDLDAQHLPMRQAVEQVLAQEFGSVICCSPGTLAYYRPEAPVRGHLLEKSPLRR